MDVMIRAIRPQLPKHTTVVIIFAKTRPIPPLEMGKRACQQTKKAPKTQKNLTLRVSEICE
jgi:hypothetical protein